MNVYCLYFPNGKRYVGVESQTGKRIRDHERMASLSRKDRPQVVHLAIRKHGWENVRWRYLATNCSRQEAAQLERFFIRTMRLREDEWGYNRTDGGEGEFGTARRTPEQNRRHGESQKKNDVSAWLNTPDAIAKRAATYRRNQRIPTTAGKPNRGQFKAGREAPGYNQNKIGLPAGPNGERRFFRPEQLI